jgi:hypothetical protein
LRLTRLPSLDDTQDMVVQVLVAQITVDRIIGLDCLRSNAGSIDLQNSMLDVDGKRVSLKYAGKLGCFRVVITLQYYPVYYSDLLSLRS